MNSLSIAFVALGYAVLLIGGWRIAIAFRRRRGQGYASLAWLDWPVLLEGLPQVPAVLEALSAGRQVPEKQLVEAGFSGDALRWAHWLSQIHSEPRIVVAQIEHAGLQTLQAVYLREWLHLNHLINPLNLEWSVFRSKLRLSKALNALGQNACLFLLRAQASSLLGQNVAVVDDLARAVFFSKEDRRYLERVTSLSMVQEERPAFARVCQQSLEQRLPAAEGSPDA